MIKVFLALFVCSMFLFAADAQTIIKKVEDNLNGKSADMDFSMIVQTKKSKRTIKMNSLSIGKDKSFIKITYPRKDRGITFLKIDHKMWQYVPRIERIIKIPASMMLQSWMGSDFSNDDLVKESSISEDYDARFLKEKEDQYIIELIAKEDAAVVWGKIHMGVSKKYHLPSDVKYFDEDGELIRVLKYKKIKRFGERFYPALWEMIPLSENKKGHKTIIKIDRAVFDKEIKSSYFTKRALKRYSK